MDGTKEGKKTTPKYCWCFFSHTHWSNRTFEHHHCQHQNRIQRAKEQKVNVQTRKWRKKIDCDYTERREKTSKENVNKKDERVELNTVFWTLSSMHFARQKTTRAKYFFVLFDFCFFFNVFNISSDRSGTLFFRCFYSLIHLAMVLLFFLSLSALHSSHRYSCRMLVVADVSVFLHFSSAVPSLSHSCHSLLIFL